MQFRLFPCAYFSRSSRSPIDLSGARGKWSITRRMPDFFTVSLCKGPHVDDPSFSRRNPFRHFLRKIFCSSVKSGIFSLKASCSAQDGSLLVPSPWRFPAPLQISGERRTEKGAGSDMVFVDRVGARGDRGTDSLQAFCFPPCGELFRRGVFRQKRAGISSICHSVLYCPGDPVSFSRVWNVYHFNGDRKSVV